jgi:glycosyltransferase involved in cell wall biosynthesis
MDKIKILFFNRDKGGVNYFRTETPAIQLKNDYSDLFDITIKDTIKSNDMDSIFEEFKGYDIIQYHRSLLSNQETNLELIKRLKNINTKLIVDVDDYWILDKIHPMYQYSIDTKLKDLTIQNLINADYVTTTTEEFKKQILKYNTNVKVLYNSINPELQPQFKNNNKFDREVVNITYLGGSSHLHDLKLLEGVINLLNSDQSIKGKFKIILGGFDTTGSKTEKVINPEFVKAMQVLNLYNNKLISSLKANKGDISKIKEIPQQVSEVFKDKVFITKKRDIKPEESVYFEYEKILTNNYKLIDNNSEYINFLKKFSKEKYVNENSVPYIRRWTAKTNEYAKILDESDILLAPLVDNSFNNMKSNLKQIEAMSRKLPIICSDIIPYNVDGINGNNCILIKDKKNQEKDWAKSIKKLILDKNLRSEIGNNLYNDFKDKYNLIEVTKSRAELYEMIFKTYEELV